MCVRMYIIIYNGTKHIDYPNYYFDLDDLIFRNNTHTVGKFVLNLIYIANDPYKFLLIQYNMDMLNNNTFQYKINTNFI